MPRGQKSSPTPRLIANPIATSSSRTTPDLPAGRLNEVEQDEEDDGEAGLAGGERDRPRGVGGEQNRRRQHGPEHGLVGADRDHEARADDEAHSRPRQSVDDRRAGGQGVRAQDRQRPQDDPEGVLEAGLLRDEHGDGQPDRAPNAVPEPDRAERWRARRRAARRLQRLPSGTCSGRQERVIGDLPCRVGEHADPERRLESGLEILVSW